MQNQSATSNDGPVNPDFSPPVQQTQQPQQFVWPPTQVCVATASMGGLDLAAAAPVTTAARLVADAYMTAPADVAAAPTAAAAVGPVSCMDFISRDKLCT